MQWATRVPRVLITALLAWIAPLQAEESILESRRVAMGVGRLKPDQARQIAREWRTMADALSPTGAPKARPISAFAGKGVRVVIEGPRGH